MSAWLSKQALDSGYSAPSQMSVLVCATFAASVGWGFDYLPASVFPTTALGLGLSDAQIRFVFAVGYILPVIMTEPARACIAKCGRMSVFAGGAVLVIVGNLGFGSLTQPVWASVGIIWVAVFFRILVASGLVALDLTGLGFVVDAYPENQTWAMSIYFAGQCIGCSITPGFGAAIFTISGYETAFILPTTAFLLLIIPTLHVLCRSATTHEDSCDVERKNSGSAWAQVRRMPLSALLLRYVMNVSMYTFVCATMELELISIAKKSEQEVVSYTGFMIAYLTFMSLVGSLLAGKVGTPAGPSVRQALLGGGYVMFLGGSALALWVVLPLPIFDTMRVSLHAIALALIGMSTPYMSISLRADMEDRLRSSSTDSLNAILQTAQRTGLACGSTICSAAALYIGYVPLVSIIAFSVLILTVLVASRSDHMEIRENKTPLLA